MRLRRFRAQIKLAVGFQYVVVEADDLLNARQLLEAQFGRGNLLWGPVELLTGT